MQRGIFEGDSCAAEATPQAEQAFRLSQTQAREICNGRSQALRPARNVTLSGIKEGKERPTSALNQRW